MDSNNIEIFKEEYVDKTWGHEQIFTNGPFYAAKALVLNPKSFCSWHMHKSKIETFILMEGNAILQYGWEEDVEHASSIEMEKGHAYLIERGMKHRVISNANGAKILEVSTTDYPDDSFRFIESGVYE